MTIDIIFKRNKNIVQSFAPIYEINPNEHDHLLENVLSDCVGKLAAIVDVIGEWYTACCTIPLDGKTSEELKFPLSIRGRFTFVYRCPISLGINPACVVKSEPSRVVPSAVKIDLCPWDSDIFCQSRRRKLSFTVKENYLFLKPVKTEKLSGNLASRKL